MSRRPMTEKQIAETLSMRPISAWPYPRILFYILKSRALSYMDTVYDSQLAIVSQGPMRVKASSARIDVSRNRGALVLLQNFQYTHILMVDNDHVLPEDLIQRLARWVMADPEKLIIASLNVKRTPPYEPCVWVNGPDGVLVSPYKFKRDGLYEVEAVGTGAILISRKVFERLEPPYFFNMYDQDRVWKDSWPGEDMGFSKKVREAGIKIYMDTTTVCPHVVERTVTIDDYRKAMAADPDAVETIIEMGGANTDGSD